MIDPNPVVELKQPQTIGDLMRDLISIRRAKTDLAGQIKVLNEQEEPLEAALLAKLDESGTDSAKVKGVATATISETDVAVVEDWDAFYAFIKAEDAFYLLQRRVSNPSFREILDGGGAVPGARKFTERKVNLRAA